MSDEIRRSPVDDAQRLAEIRRRAWSKGWLPPTSNVAFLLDHIDTLTARAEKAEDERDALRIRLEDCTVALAQTGAGSIVIDDPDEEGQ
jgi:acyl carrier protein phosphodiesterase